MAGDAPALQHVLIAFWLRLSNTAPSRPTKKISCFPDSFGVRSLVRYCTVTSVPTGISEKNLRAVSSGNRMQPCDAG